MIVHLASHAEKSVTHVAKKFISFSFLLIHINHHVLAAATAALGPNAIN